MHVKVSNTPSAFKRNYKITINIKVMLRDNICKGKVMQI